jgi:hypothetical protein
LISAAPVKNVTMLKKIVLSIILEELQQRDADNRTTREQSEERARELQEQRAGGFVGDHEHLHVLDTSKVCALVGVSVI